jgi:hypothetical protein
LAERERGRSRRIERTCIEPLTVLSRRACASLARCAHRLHCRDLDIALDSALKRQKNELREMEARKRELQELSQQQRFRPSEDVSTFKIIKSIKELVAAMLPILGSMREDWVMVVPSGAAVIASQIGINEAAYEFIQRGGTIRVILNDITYPIVQTVQEMMDNGEDVRHFGREGIIFTVFDKKICLSAISANVTRIALNEPIIALWTDDPVYARYLLATFETLWEQSVPAAERIQQLLKQGPPQA